MSMTRHNSIIVTSLDCFAEKVQKAHEEAITFFGNRVTPIIKSPLNGIVSFFIATDGSKEGWKEADDAKKDRKKFCKYLDSFVFGDGSSPFAYLDVEYGEEYTGNTAFIAKANMKIVEGKK